MVLNEKIEFRKIREFNEIISTLFDFIKQNYKIILTSLAGISFPCFLLGTLLQYFVFFSRSEFQGIFTIHNLVLYNISIILYHLPNLLILLAIVKLYREKGPGEITFSDVFKQVKAEALRQTVTLYSVVIMTFLGLMFCLVPGIYFSVLFSIIFAVRTFEQLTFGQSYERCKVLMKDNWWNSFGLYAFLGILVGIMGIIFSIPTYIVTFLNVFHNNGEVDPGLFKNPALFIASIIASLNNFMSIIIYTGMVLQYFNLAEKKESTGLMDKLNSMEPEVRN